MIKVLQMPVRNAKGGITQYALRNWEHIDKSRFIFDWVTLDKELSFEKELEQQGCKVHHLSCRQEDDEQRFRDEMKSILSGGYDVLHLHTSYWRGFLAEELALEAGIAKIIVHAHSTGVDISDDIERKKLLAIHNEWKSRFNNKLATHFAACSMSAAGFLFGPQIPEDSIKILNNAIDTDKFAFDIKKRAEIRRKLNIEDKLVIIQPARLEHQKNPQFTLRVFSNIVKQVPEAVLLYVGDGSLRSQLKNEANESGLSDNVRFLGFQNNISNLLQASDLFVMPSHFEGLGISAIEAQCSGLFCLLSEKIPREAVITGKTKCLKLNEKLWVDEINMLAQKGYKRENCSGEVISAGFSLKKQVGKLEELYTGEE